MKLVVLVEGTLVYSGSFMQRDIKTNLQIILAVKYFKICMAFAHLMISKTAFLPSTLRQVMT